MGDPQRLLGWTSNSDQLERELLESLRDVSPRQGMKARTWNRLAIQVAAVATLGAGSATVQALGRAGTVAVLQTTKLFTAKVILGVALAGSTVIGGGWWLKQRADAPIAVLSIPPRIVTMPALPVAPVLPLERIEVAPLPVPTAAKAVESSAKNVEDGRARRDLLSVESRMLTDARAQLHAGDPRSALATLEKLRARSPKGVLSQERDVLAIQIASALGDTATAKRKAKAFLGAHPESPHAPQLRRLTDDP